MIVTAQCQEASSGDDLLASRIQEWGGMQKRTQQETGHVLVVTRQSLLFPSYEAPDLTHEGSI